MGKFPRHSQSPGQPEGCPGPQSPQEQGSPGELFQGLEGTSTTEKQADMHTQPPVLVQEGYFPFLPSFIILKKKIEKDPLSVL